MDHRNDDTPMYSRLFIVCSRDLTEEDFSTAFKEFGEIEDVRVPCDRNTGERKGVAFVKFAKTSQAAKALEAMNRKFIGGGRPIRVMVAANRSDIQGDDNNKIYQRIFIQVSKSPNDDTEKDLHQHFSQYGNVEDILIQTDRNTGQRRGFAYVRFRKFSEAAIAIEECDKKYRAIFAQPQGERRIETPFESNINSLASSSATQNASLISMMNVNPRGFTSVNFLCNPYLTHPYVEALFDIVPGMIECQYFVDLVKNVGKGTVQYANPISAAYAVEKINEFEYPPRHCVYVRPGNSRSNNDTQMNIPGAFKRLRDAIDSNQNSGSPDLAQLTEAIAEASKLVKMATGVVAGDSIPDSNDLNYCSVKLPPPQPLAGIDDKVEKRLFLVCKPQPPPLTVLRDVFCRFGNLINVYTLPNKTVGYARYASSQSADQAIKTLHGAEVCGVRMKVLEAEEEAPPKRMRYDQ